MFDNTMHYKSPYYWYGLKFLAFKVKGDPLKIKFLPFKMKVLVFEIKFYPFKMILNEVNFVNLLP
jgi:hypothetical protein